MPVSRRRIDLESLPSHGASPIYASSDAAEQSSTANDSPVGIQINQWKITTQNSSIGDEKGMDSLTTILEDIANTNNSVSQDASVKNHRRRRLCAPEITFLNASISLKHLNGEMRFNATDALKEWAEAHRFLDHTNNDTDANTTCQKQHRGVQILQTKDAKTWSEKSSKSKPSSSEFYYDWSFATPYAGTIHVDSTTEDISVNRMKWKPTSQSQIPFHLLQDTSQPILLYDDISLFEDDLHDNGDASLNIKIRVMPMCWYVLQRLFVRVDFVCLKVREVRMFCYFGQANAALKVERHTIYRDVTWREANWEDLIQLGLPSDPARWRCNGENAAVLAQLISRLPIFGLPVDLPAHSRISLE